MTKKFILFHIFFLLHLIGLRTVAPGAVGRVSKDPWEKEESFQQEDRRPL